MIDKKTIEEAALRLRNAEESKETCPPVRDLIDAGDQTSAYAIQQMNTAIKLANGGTVVGQKIGLTAPVVQKQLGVDQPDFGLLWGDKEIPNGGTISVQELMQPKVEAEIAFVLKSDLTNKDLTNEDIIEAIDYALPSIEVVGSRIANWDIKIADTIADNASASHWVVGSQPIALDAIDLMNCKMVMKNNLTIVSEGQGSDCLGSPINAVCWLANKMVEMGTPMKKGDLVLSGALGPMCAVSAGDYFTVEIEGLGTVEVGFVD